VEGCEFPIAGNALHCATTPQRSNVKWPRDCHVTGCFSFNFLLNYINLFKKIKVLTAARRSLTALGTDWRIGLKQVCMGKSHLMIIK